MTFKTISELFYSTVTSPTDKNIFFYKKDGSWNGISKSQVLDMVSCMTFAFRKNKIGSGNNVAIISSNSPFWAISDYGIICSGAASVSIYPTLIPNQIKYIINNSESVSAFVENQEQLGKVQQIWDECPLLNYVIVMDNSWDGSDNRILNLSDFLNTGRAFQDSSDISFKDLVKIPKPDDLLTLIYTSGTTGDPKGVMLSHQNMVSNVLGTMEKIEFFEDDIFLSYLPLSHSFERMGGHFTAFSKGSTVYYSESIEALPQNMIDVKPTVMLSVPRLYEKMYAKVLDNINSASGLKQKIFWWSIGTGREILDYNIKGKTVPFSLEKKYNLAKKLVFNKIKDKIGGRLRYFVSGGAPLSQEIAEFFAAANVMILEGYGLTETSPVLTANTPSELRFGTVGKPLNNVEVKIAPDGEIIVRGPNIMLGYYKNEQETRDVLNNEGWFSTGDIGFLDDDGYLKITDRKKNILVTSGGKNIAPAPIENSLINSIYIDQAVVIGDQRNFISALIVPNFEYVGKYLSSKEISISDPEAIVEHPEAISLFEKEVQNAMESFSHYERIKKFTLLSSLFTIEKGEITPSLKIVRKVVIRNYSDLIESMYSERKN